MAQIQVYLGFAGQCKEAMTCYQQCLGSDLGGRLEPGQTVSLMVQCDSHEQTEAYFGNLTQGGTVTQPLTASFWGSTFGHLTDRYGVQWMLNEPH